MLKVQEEMREKQRIADLAREQRFFETTNKADFTNKDLQQNTVGRRVMLTQDAKTVSMDNRDEQFIVEHGVWRRGQKTTDEELSQRIPKGDYMQQQPVTIWTHTQERKNYWMSAAVGSNPFARTSGFTQPADQTKSVSGYYGNIDFDRESSRVDFRKSVGKDLSHRNPYVEKELPYSNFQTIAQRILDNSSTKGTGLKGLEIFLRTHIDKAQDGMVDPEQLRFGLRAYGVEIK